MKKIAIIPGSFKPPHWGHFTLIKELLKDKSIDKIYIIISPKSRNLIKNNKNSGEISAIQSEKIWKIYLDELISSSNRSRIGLMISRLPSPLNMAFAIAKGLKKGDELILIKSDKNTSNTRFDMFKKLGNGIKIKEWILKTFKNLNSTNMRKTIYEKNKQEFMKFLPPKLSKKNVDLIWKIVRGTLPPSP